MNVSTTPLLVVELGNPGPEYRLTRHNVECLVLDELASRTSPMPSSFSVRKKPNAEIVRTRFKTSDGGKQRVIPTKLRTYINLSGGPIAALAKLFNVAPADVVVVYDELDLDPSVVHLERGGGENGHSGLRSTSKSLGTKDYTRAHIGIGRPSGRQDPVDHVLCSFNAREREELAFTLSTAVEAVEPITSHGLEIAQNQVHGRQQQREESQFHVPGSSSLYSSSVFMPLGVFAGGFALSTERLVMGLGKLRQGIHEGIDQAMQIRRPGSSPPGTPTARRNGRSLSAVHHTCPVL